MLMPKPGRREMAPSNKSFLVALLFAVVAAPCILQPSSAAFSFPPIFPCIPGFPRIPLFPCIEPPPLPAPPTECRSHLMKMMPCAGYLTNSSVTGASQRVLRQLQPGPRRLGGDMLLPRRQRRHPAAAAGAHDLQAHALRHRPMRRQSTNGSIGQTLRWYV